jgi:crossover junction endodeoxyribonuclease RuvC
MLEVVRATRPDCMVVEELWSAPKHPPTAVLMGHARGVIALAAGLCEVAFEELSHVTVKRALTGNGAARKEQVKSMVCVHLGLTIAPQPDDVSDALALALVFAMRGRSPDLVMKRAPSCRPQLPPFLRARNAPPTLGVGGAQARPERL